MATAVLSTVEEIQEAIARLSPDDYQRLLKRLAELDEKAWDRQIEADCSAGRLDHVLAEVEADIAAGRFKKL